MPTTRKKNLPLSTIDKWLHFDRNYTHQQVYKLLDITPQSYSAFLQKPTKFEIGHVEQLAYLLDKDIPEVFYCLYKPRLSDNPDDLKKFKLVRTLSKLGIK